MIPFVQFRENLFARTSKPVHSKEVVRIFIWSLVDKVQQEHRLRKCLKVISPETVLLVEGVAYITSKRIPYSFKRAKADYASIRKLLLEELFFREIGSLSYGMENFLKLLVDEHTKDDFDEMEVLMSKHVSILPKGLLISFFTNLYLVPRTLTFDQRQIYFCDVIDKELTVCDWRNEIRQKDKCLLKGLKYAASAYSNKYPAATRSNCPATRNYWLIRYWRNCGQHLGIEKRTKFKATKKYKKWKNKNPLHKPEEYVNYGGHIPKCFRGKTVSKLNKRFPTFLTDVQKALHKNHLLEFFSINPWERCMV